MRKNLSLLIALAICLNTAATCFAAGADNSTSNTVNNTVQTDTSTVNLTMDDAVNNIEKNNTEINLMKQKLVPLNNQYDLDHGMAISLKTDMPGINKLQVEIQQLITPLKDEQSVKNQKYDIDVRLNNIKLDMERQYLNILTCNDQIDNINKTLTNIDEQINKLQQQINLGLATADALNDLNVQKSQLQTQITSINDSIDNSMLIMKQYLNMDLSKSLILDPAKKDYVKFDDTNIEDQINKALEKDYGISEAQLSVQLAEEENKLYVQNDNNSSGGVSGSESDLLTAQNNVSSTTASAKAGLWNKYYTLKSDENAVETQELSEKAAQDAYDKAKSNYDNGMTDKLAVDTAALALDKEKTMKQRTINEYMIVQQEFKYMLDGHASAQASTQSVGVSGIDY